MKLKFSFLFNINALVSHKKKLKNPELYIHGTYQKATGAEFVNINPATGKEISKFMGASPQQADEAVQSATKGFLEWSAYPPVERGRILQKAAQILRERNKELAELEVLDTGKPISEALYVDVHSGADAIEYFAGIAASIHGDHYSFGETFAFTRREPLGVCLGIGAWNYPIQIACWKSAPALACGNSMIFKPAELTPLTALKLAEIYAEAGLPDGVFNVVQGGAETGAYLTSHPGIAKVSLTGEVGTGKKVMASASKSLKKVTLELGGKSPIIVFDDADISEAVQGAMLGNFYTQGEICSNGTRVYVANSILQDFIDELVAKTKKLKIGDPMNPDVHVGALISANHMDKVMQCINEGIKSGAKLIYGGSKYIPEDEHIKDGYYVEPTIFLTDDNENKLVKNEIFGPVMTILGFDDEKEVIDRANDTEFGLAGGVFTKDLQRGHRVANQLQCGMCWINNYNITPVEVPFGGYKNSGIGRENGLAAIEHYTQLKTVYVEMGKIDSPYR